MTNFLIRDACVQDIPRLIDIESACFPTDKISKRQMRYSINHGKNIFLVACDKELNLPVGYGLCFTPSMHKTARLYSLAVLQEYRGAHIATNILSCLLSKLKSNGYQYCNLEVRASDTNTHSLYEKFGFKRVVTLPQYYQDNEDALRFQLSFE